MKWNYKLRFVLISVYVMPLLLGAQTYERTREVGKSFPVNDRTEIHVINKYGNVHVVNWEKDSVKFEISLVVKGNKQSKIQKNFDLIDFSFTKTAYYVVAETKFGTDKGSFWDEVSDLANTIFSGSNRTQIDYRVYMPKSCPLKIDNKFGNIYIGDHDGRCEINLSNGDMKANEFSEKLLLNIDFGSANIRTISDARVVASYAEVDIRRADLLDLDSKSSHFELGIVGEIKLISRRDDLRVDEVGSLMGELSFSELQIDNFTTTGVLTSSYGSMNFRTVNEGFRSIVIKAEYTDIDLNIERDAEWELILEHADKSEISLPADFQVTGEKPAGEEGTVQKIAGKIGAGNNLPPIDIRIIAGHVFITNY